MAIAADISSKSDGSMVYNFTFTHFTAKKVNSKVVTISNFTFPSDSISTVVISIQIK